MSLSNTYQANNVFSKIIKGQLPCTKIFEDETLLAVKDINPVAPTHILVITKKEVYSFDQFAATSSAEEVGTFFQKVRKIAVDSGCEKEGFRIVMNHGLFAEQIVPQFHVHILGGRVLGQMATIPDHQVDHGRMKHHDEEVKKE